MDKAQAGKTNTALIPPKEEIFSWIEHFASYGHRRSGTENNRKSAQFIADKFREFGLEDIRFDNPDAKLFFPKEWSLKVNGEEYLATSSITPTTPAKSANSIPATSKPRWSTSETAGRRTSPRWTSRAKSSWPTTAGSITTWPTLRNTTLPTSAGGTTLRHDQVLRSVHPQELLRPVHLPAELLRRGAAGRARIRRHPRRQLQPLHPLQRKLFAGIRQFLDPEKYDFNTMYKPACGFPATRASIWQS